MGKKRIISAYSRKIQRLLPRPLDFAELGLKDQNLFVHLDRVKHEFSVLLNSYLKSCLKGEINVIPAYCLPSAIEIEVENRLTIVADVGLKNIRNINILRSVYGALRNRLIHDLLKAEAHRLGFTTDDL